MDEYEYNWYVQRMTPDERESHNDRMLFKLLGMATLFLSIGIYDRISEDAPTTYTTIPYVQQLETEGTSFDPDHSSDIFTASGGENGLAALTEAPDEVGAIASDHYDHNVAQIGSEAYE